MNTSIHTQTKPQINQIPRHYKQSYWLLSMLKIIKIHDVLSLLNFVYLLQDLNRCHSIKKINCTKQKKRQEENVTHRAELCSSTGDLEDSSSLWKKQIVSRMKNIPGTWRLLLSGRGHLFVQASGFYRIHTRKDKVIWCLYSIIEFTYSPEASFT